MLDNAGLAAAACPHNQHPRLARKLAPKYGPIAGAEISSEDDD